MRFGQSSNPIFGKKAFNYSASEYGAETMTLQGTINKTILLFLLTLLTASITWKMVGGESPIVYPLMIGGAIGGFVVALVTIFKKEWSAITAPLYAALEGLFLGAFSAFMEAMFPGIAIMAVGITFGVFAMILFLYKTGVLKASPRFVKGIFIATTGVALFYVVNMVASMFGASVQLANMGLIGIGIQLLIVGIAALNLVLDFAFIEQNASSQAPKYMEWFGAFGLMMTLIWLYIEIVRLLTLLMGRD